MKKLFKLIIVLVLVAAIGVGGFLVLKKTGVLPGSDNDATTTTTETTTTLFNRPIEATGEAITEEELKALYETANNLYLDWVNPVYGPKVDWDTTVESNGWNYCPVTSGKYEDVDSIKKDLQNYFSENLYDDYVNAHFIMYDGKLYAREDLGQGGDAYCDSIKLEIISVSETECTFKVSEIRSYDSRITSHTYKIKVVDGMWKFVDSFEPSYAASFFDNHIVWDK